MTGLVLATITGSLVVPFIGLYMQGSNSGSYYISQIPHVFLFLLIVVVNTLLGRLRRAQASSWSPPRRVVAKVKSRRWETTCAP